MAVEIEREKMSPQTFRSTRGGVSGVSLRDAVLMGQAPDGGLFMPQELPRMSSDFMKELPRMSFNDISFRVARNFLGSSVSESSLRKIVEDAFDFDIGLNLLGRKTYLLELFHGPTAAFKDFGARFMARLLAYELEKKNGDRRPLTVLVATSGDTGSAVASGFLDMKGIRVTILYPKGKVSKLQEKQLTTYGEDSNIWTLEVDGTFDDCKRLVKSAFDDPDLDEPLRLTSANSINIARLLPQSFYYFWAYGRLRMRGYEDDVVFSVPSGNFGNLTAGVLAKRMGLPVHRFIAATNVNKEFINYLKTGKYEPSEQSIATNSPSMDVARADNFERLMDLYNNNWERINREIWGDYFTDSVKNTTITKIFKKYGYVMDPHSVIAYLGLEEYRRALEDEGEEFNGLGVVLMTAHPAKFPDTVEPLIGEKIPVPPTIKLVMRKEKDLSPISAEYEEFKQFLIDNKDLE